MAAPRSIRLREMRLGGDFGRAWEASRTVVLDPAAHQTERERLDTLIHEALHLEFPDLSEDAVAGRPGLSLGCCGQIGGDAAKMQVDFAFGRLI